MHIVFWLFQIRSVPLNIFPSMSCWPLDLHPNFLQEKTTYDRLPNWHEDRNGVVRMCEFTWAAEGSRALQQPSSDLIYFCTSLWCCTLASMCCPGSGSTSGPHPPSPHSTRFLINEQNTNQATVFKDKRCSLVKGRSCFCWEKVLQENQKHIFFFLDTLTLGSESEPGQVRFARQWEGFAVDELPLPFTKLQQLDTESLLAIETCGCGREMTHTRTNIRPMHYFTSWLITSLFLE